MIEYKRQSIKLEADQREEEMINDINNKQFKNQYLNIYKALYVSCGFLLLFIAFNSTQNLTTEVSKQNKMDEFGYIQLAVLYLSNGLSSLVAPAAVKQLGLKKSLFLGGIGHFVFIFLSMFPAWNSECAQKDNQPSGCENEFLRNEALIRIVLIICAIINGIGAALLWVAQGEYFALCMTEETKGFYYGFFWSIYQSSQIFGNLAGAVILHQNHDKTFFFLIMSLLALFASCTFIFTQRPFIPDGKLMDSYHLAHQSQYFTDSVVGQSMIEQRFSGLGGILGSSKRKYQRGATDMSEDLFAKQSMSTHSNKTLSQKNQSQ